MLPQHKCTRLHICSEFSQAIQNSDKFFPPMPYYLLGPMERKLKAEPAELGVPVLAALSMRSTQLNTRPCCRFASMSNAGPWQSEKDFT